LKTCFRMSMVTKNPRQIPPATANLSMGMA